MLLLNPVPTGGRHQLSTGMKQRCAIARAVMHQPRIVILDEPTTGLDAMSAQTLLVTILPGVELNWMWSMVPLTNVSLAMKELVKGTMDYRLFSLIMLSSTLVAGTLLLLCRWWFNREQVLFRD